MGHAQFDLSRLSRLPIQACGRFVKVVNAVGLWISL